MTVWYGEFNAAAFFCQHNGGEIPINPSIMCFRQSRTTNRKEFCYRLAPGNASGKNLTTTSNKIPRILAGNPLETESVRIRRFELMTVLELGAKMSGKPPR